MKPIVTFEVAKLLSKLGFEQKAEYSYKGQPDDTGLLNINYANFVETRPGWYAAPYIYSALNWAKANLGIYITVVDESDISTRAFSAMAFRVSDYSGLLVKIGHTIHTFSKRRDAINELLERVLKDKLAE